MIIWLAVSMSAYAIATIAYALKWKFYPFNVTLVVVAVFIFVVTVLDWLEWNILAMIVVASISTLGAILEWLAFYNRPYQYWVYYIRKLNWVYYIHKLNSLIKELYKRRN